MAQIDGKEGALWARASLIVRQRPLWGVASALVIGLVAGAVAFGGVVANGMFGGAQASPDGFEIESSDSPGDGDDLTESDVDAASEGGDGGGGGEPSQGLGPVVVVDVAGAVARPGVYELKEGDRVDDAIDMAGGVGEDADMSGVNRATLLVDGQRVFIPRLGEQVPGGASASASNQVGEVAGAPSPPSAAQPVNINTAGVSELDALPGVGPATAQAIVEDRKESGPFTMVEDIMRVSGIGEKKFEKLKSLICV